MTSPDDPPESLPSPGTRGRRTDRTRAKRGAPRFLGRPQRVAEVLSATPPPVAISTGPEAPGAAPPEERHFDEADEQFFLAEDSLAPTELAVSDLAEAKDAEAGLAPRSRLESPRRRALARYVGVVVLLAAAFCVAAFTARANKPAPAAAAKARPAAVVPAPVPANLVAPPQAPSVVLAAERAPSVIDPAAALDARERARSALSKGDVRTAVSVGTQSIELDPSDAEAWLVLGAAEMAIGERGQALSTFRACTKVATRGPRHECGQMLQ